jgi:hypothetical protein
MAATFGFAILPFKAIFPFQLQARFSYLPFNIFGGDPLVNTEELERSLRSEFDDQFKKALADARVDVQAFQKDLEEQFENHRARVSEVFASLASRLESPGDADRAFTESVVEHLRLARDEGARITATAMGEADKLVQSQSAPPANYSGLRDAIAKIKEQQTQAAILKTLVEAAAEFAPRGAFFIVKSDHLVGWKNFGSDLEENVVRSIHFPLSAETMLSDAVNSLSTRVAIGESDGDNSVFLGPLGFDAPSGMVAVPLSARGRGVAVLYADGGDQNYLPNVEALETLVSVAGLTVELRATATAPPAGVAPVNEDAAVSESVDREADAEEQEQKVEDEYTGSVAVADEEQTIEGAEDCPSTSEFAFSTSNFSETAGNGHVAEAEEHEAAKVDTPFEAVAEAPRRRLSDRSMDLPIEVSDDERRPHSDARRFARLLISEIKLYNEQKVAEGREAGEIYEVLKEAIDRSREMYDKRVQPDVAAKFDYFHYELVNNLAQGDEEKLGAGYMAVRA